MENDLSQYLHLYGCSPVWVRRCRVRFADLGNIFPQNRQAYFPPDLPGEVAKPGGLLFTIDSTALSDDETTGVMGVKLGTVNGLTMPVGR